MHRILCLLFCLKQGVSGFILLDEDMAESMLFMGNWLYT
jgi:hypothetical protein